MNLLNYLIINQLMLVELVNFVLVAFKYFK